MRGDKPHSGVPALSAPENSRRDLTGKNVRTWFVVANAGERDGVQYWRCMCRAALVEKIVAEPDILDRKLNVLRSIHYRWQKQCESPIGWIFGEWTVLALARERPPKPPRKPGPIWTCRCICGTERDIPWSDLTPPFRQTVSCGCRPDAEVRAELQAKMRQAKQGFSAAMGDMSRCGLERRFDKNWTPDMERALRRFQPACVLCGATSDLTTHHVEPLGLGHGLEPGNAVRLCRVCNSGVGSRRPSDLSPRQARKLETAAAQFKEHWQSGCTTLPPVTAESAVELPKAPDPEFVGLLRAVECGDDTAIATLANWLEKRGDPRAAAVRDVSRWVTRRETILSKTRLAEKGSRSATPEKLPAVAEGSLAQRYRELRQYLLVNEVCKKLRLLPCQWHTLKQYLGITGSGVASTMEEIAEQEGKKVQTIRARIELAVHRLTIPHQQGHRSS
jgi:5-methylcytosine-specific restriction endonuclease McrA